MSSQDLEPIVGPHMALINAMEIVRVGIAFDGAVKTGLISPANFPPWIRLDTPGEPRRVRTSFEEGQLERAAHNLDLATTCVAVIAADSALDDHFAVVSPGTPKPVSRRDKRSVSEYHGIDAVRALLYMIRCAFAHDPFNPVWRVGRTQAGVLSIDDLGITIDMTGLDGRPLHSEVWGGRVGLFEVLGYAERAVLAMPVSG
jgi:hypothetical protein